MMIDRRMVLSRGILGSAGLALAAPTRLLAQVNSFAAPAPLIPVIARPDRIFHVTVCLRPFRTVGPRIEMETIGSKHVLHHYGHGGSGWSLSWGSALEAVPMALATGAKEIAVIGAGAIGLTTAITVQRLGAKVTIYAKERFPDVRSARATGTWSPASRIAMAGATDAAFTDKWERMTRRSFAMHQSFLGVAGNPVEWTDRYSLSDGPMMRGPSAPIAMPNGGTDSFFNQEEMVRDLTPRSETLLSGQHPFPVANVRKSTSLTFNVTDLGRQLESDFLQAGGHFVPMDLHSPADFARIKEKTIINCTGYGARALMKDESIIPVRGQIAWLLPQPGVDYGLQYNHVSMLGRRDGIVVQPLGNDEAYGFNVSDETPDYASARDGVATLAQIFAGKAPAG
jgi:hypothetical protein